MRTPLRLAILAGIGAAALPAFARTCSSLSALVLENITITAAQSVPGGDFTPPYGTPIRNLPAFCRVVGAIRPTADSDIQFEVWLPRSGWNGRFLGVGNGGFAGAIGYRALAEDLRRGYATAGTDTGHEGDAVDASWAFGHPEKVNDFGYRAVHATAIAAKEILKAFYERPATRAYFDSCSDGGREALMEAQRFPADYDGILAGAPANFWTHLQANGVDLAQSAYGNPAAYLSATKIPAINAAVLAACDSRDGVKDGILNDPLSCHFDPSVLLCRGSESRACLTAPQIASLKKFYRGGRNARGEQIIPGYLPGGETSGWAAWVLGPGPGAANGIAYVQNYFRYMVFEDPHWNLLTADVDAAEHLADAKTAHALNATDPDLGPFQARGGKLILYHGWNDPAISPLCTVGYYKSVLQEMGREKADTFLRLYMVPGMGHCFGGPGPNSFGQGGHTTAQGPKYGIYSALEQWVEKGAPPGEIIATKYAQDLPAKGVTMTRPLCPYPQLAKYKGVGNPMEAAAFVCAAPAK